MLLAPRHPERFDSVAELLQHSKIKFWRRSQWNGEPMSGAVLLIDSIGELSSLYALADIAFVGGSLVPRGGHNIIEPAQHGVPILVGTHTENFRDIAELFKSRNAVRVVSRSDLGSAFLELLANETQRRELGRRAVETLDAQRGATQRTLHKLQELLTAQSHAAKPA
jgi:3-deoxy-D-manno-octulosonic-acid transferase